MACSFGLMVPSSLIDTFKNVSYVVHPSLLPKHRGASPISGVFLGGENETGVSIVGMSKDKFDAGEIYL